MPRTLTVAQQSGTALTVPIDDGQCVFVLGANGSGKSGLMHSFYGANRPGAVRITAHRQTWFASSALALSPEQKRQTEVQIHNTDAGSQARWKDDYSAQRASIAIYDLIDAENVRARSITAEVDGGNMDAAVALSKRDSPISIINELLRLSNIPVEISVRKNEQVMASKQGGVSYSVAELSDGERNALLIAATVLTATPGTLLLIDEPERHLHRSIISPLLTLLLARRQDCSFVVSTHDPSLPLDNAGSRTLLVRGCTHSGANFAFWDLDLIPADAPIDDDIKRDILGSRRKVVFIEGDHSSLDEPLYSLVFPSVSVVPKAGCDAVETAVRGIRGEPHLHWVHAFGIVDNDRRTPEDIERLKALSVYALSVYAVESIYFHPEMQRRVALRHAAVVGGDTATRLATAKAAAIEAVRPHVARLSSRAIEKTIRHQIEASKPTQAAIATGTAINISIDVAAALAAEQAVLIDLLDSQDLEAIVSRYPVRETAALIEIAKRLGFQNRSQYEGAVRRLLIDDAGALTFVRTLFGTLYLDITAA